MLSVQFGNNNFIVPGWQVWLFVSLTIAFVLTFYVLRSIGIYKLAKKAKLKNSFLAWIPLLWMYTACMLIGNEKFFGKPYTKLAVLFCVLFSVAEVLSFTQTFLINFPLIGNYLMGREIIFAPPNMNFKDDYSQWVSGVWVGRDFVNPYGAGLLTVETIVNVISSLMMILSIVNIIITVNIYISLFRRYWPQHHMLFGLLSIFFGLFPVFVFVIRNREPINYTDYLRARYNQMYYGAQNNPNGPDPFGQNPNVGNQGPVNPGDPFSDFADKKDVDPGDPFADFNKNDNEDDK